jgi:hypothetical protein
MPNEIRISSRLSRTIEPNAERSPRNTDWINSQTASRESSQRQRGMTTDACPGLLIASAETILSNQKQKMGEPSELGKPAGIAQLGCLQ